ncbi:NodT family efflux transporter outer membrane factor (OMF) lipoprotein [Sphingomonas faeni]|uniref:NodT family efflux transporter outer membrane factor (OMF) lipoprotein n=1 Tax=Sphingomonas faeni TaxID=185950 RepID=A0A2T5U8W5_9SPHN|nr:NodT family efflux transporter outer membrane factor (OMF) lipoprotein [Sphingomonas faeni]
MSATVVVNPENWWSQLGDPVIDQLVSAGLNYNPTLAEAAARVDQARAFVAVRNAGKVPAAGIEGSATRTRDRFDSSGSPSQQTSAALGPRLFWELDLWRRVREGANAARHRVGARTADARSARLSIIGDIADTVIALRACILTRESRDRDIASRETELTIGRVRLALGSIAPVALATAQSNLASARTDRIAQEENCLRLIDALVALSGVEATKVRDLVALHPHGTATRDTGEVTNEPWLPVPPSSGLALPATVLLENPGVMAAENEAAARWSEVAVARAERLPRVDLAAVLTGQWIRALGSDTSFMTNSLGATLSGPLFDGGAGAGNVRRAQAAYREAVAQLSLTVRITIRDIEDALAARQSAALRIVTTQENLDAARFALDANAARWRAGAISQFELEDSRRQFNRAQQGVIAAAADHRLSRIGERAGTPADALHYLESFLLGAVDTSLAAQSAVVALESIGLGTCYIGGIRNKPAEVAAELGLPPQSFALFGLTIGVPDPAAPASVKPRLPQDAVLFRETYGQAAAPSALAAYDRRLRDFQREQAMTERDWTDQASQRVRGAESLAGRDVLRDVLHGLGFRLK